MSQQERQELGGLSEYNVCAVYKDLDAVREAMGAFELAGIEAAQISVLGPGAEEASAEADTSERDAEMATHVGKRVAAGAAAGGAGGGALGFLAGALAFAIPGVGPVVGAGVIASTLAGAIGGGAVGGFLGGGSALRLNEAWELTFESVKNGKSVTIVHSHSGESARKAAEAVESTQAERVDAFDREGKRIALEDLRESEEA